VRIPAAQVHLDHPRAGFNQTASDEEPLAPFFAAIQVAGGARFESQVKRILLSWQRRQQQPLGRLRGHERFRLLAIAE
jgi:hypothetical protein